MHPHTTSFITDSSITKSAKLHNIVDVKRTAAKGKVQRHGKRQASRELNFSSDAASFQGQSWPRWEASRKERLRHCDHVLLLAFLRGQILQTYVLLPVTHI